MTSASNNMQGISYVAGGTGGNSTSGSGPFGGFGGGAGSWDGCCGSAGGGGGYWVALRGMNVHRPVVVGPTT